MLPRLLYKKGPPMRLYLLTFNNGLKWHTTKYAHYISIFRIQLNIRKPSNAQN